MDNLPELPFEKVLGYLNLQDRLKARAVSRAWRNKLESFQVQTLCYSSRPSDFIFEKNRWVSKKFAENFINSTRFALFFDTFSQTILSSLKHLRLCEIDLCGYEAAFTHTLNSFGKLEKLDIIRIELNQQDEFKLNLPMLTSLQLENLRGIEKLALEAPRLRAVKLLDCSDLRVEIVHGESVEKLLIDWLEYTEVENLKNLQYLYAYQLPWTDSILLSSLQQLKEIYTNASEIAWELFAQKQRSNRTDLKIYLCGRLLNGPDDPAMDVLRYSSFDYLSGESLVCLAENRLRLADQIPFYRYLFYSSIENVAPGLEVDLLKTFTDLNEVRVDSRVHDIEHLLNLLKNCEEIVLLQFFSDQPQDLFDRLPEYSAVQHLIIYNEPSDLDFLFRLKQLIHLYVHWTIDIETVRRAFEELPVLSSVKFAYGNERASIEIGQSKQFEVSFADQKKAFFDLNSAIESITRNESQKKRKAEALESNGHLFKRSLNSDRPAI